MLKLPEPPVPHHLYIICGDPFLGRDAGPQPIPHDMRVRGMKGVYVGGCVAKGLGLLGRRGMADAHAHAKTGDQWRGWVCFQHPDDLNDKALRMHELAHILTGQGHTKRWREVMRRLGQPIPSEYQRRGGPNCT